MSIEQRASCGQDAGTAEVLKPTKLGTAIPQASATSVCFGSRPKPASASRSLRLGLRHHALCSRVNVLSFRFFAVRFKFKVSSNLN